MRAIRVLMLLVPLLILAACTQPPHPSSAPSTGLEAL
jgi:hypothetical protein